eukprot:g830.t1 g830   contig10:810676-811267(-)
MNALTGFGCIGFNTYLGPIRPFLLPLLLTSTWKLLSQRSYGLASISLLIGFLPEVVHLWNASQTRQRFNSGTTPNFKTRATLRLAIPSMGCVACVNKIDTSIRNCKYYVSSNINQERSWLTEDSQKGGMAELSIWASSSDDVQKIAEEVVSAVTNAGFECKVDSLQMDTV